MSDDYLSGWLRSDSTREDSIVLRRVFIDICGGNLSDAVILSQIVYWHTPKKNGETRLTISRDGHLWLAKGYGDWWEECRIPQGTARDALRRLEALGIIIKRVWHFDGRKMPHFRIDTVEFKRLIEAAGNGTLAALRAEKMGSKGNDPSKCRKPTDTGVSVGNQQIGDGKCWEPTDANDGNQHMQALETSTCALYIRNPETTTEITSSTIKESDSRDRGAAADSTPVDDDARQVVRQEVDKLGLSANWRDALLAMEPTRALALILHARDRGTNPAGLLVTMLQNEQPPPAGALQVAQLALQVGTTDDKALRRHELERLAREAQAIAVQRASRDGPGEGAPEQGGESLDERPGGGNLSWRDIWQAEMGQLALMLNASTFAAIRKIELVGIEGDVLKLRAPSALAQQQLERLRETIEQQLEQMTGIPVRIQVNGVTHGKSTHGTDPDAAGNVAPDRPLPADAPLRAVNAGCDGERTGHQLDERGELHDEQTTPSGVGAVGAGYAREDAGAERLPHAGRGAGVG